MAKSDPVAILSVPATAKIGEVVIIDASASHDPGGFIKSAQLNLGDGVTVEFPAKKLQPHPHIYRNAGNYTVTLSVVDNQKHAGSATATIAVAGSIIIEEPPPPDTTAPVVSIQLDQFDGMALVTVTATDADMALSGEVSIDGVGIAAGPLPLTGGTSAPLPPGPHLVEAIVLDTSLNVGIASQAFTVEAPPPEPIDEVLSEWSEWVAGPWGPCLPDGSSATTGSQSRTETRTRTVLVEAQNGGASGGPLEETRTSSQSCEIVPPPPPPAEDKDAHPRYFALASRPDAVVAWSLRSQSQIEKYRQTKKFPSEVTYDPIEDAAKIAIVGNSLKTQIWLPTGMVFPGRYIARWEAKFGHGFDRAATDLSKHKTWQFGSPGEDIWCEINTAYTLKSVPGVVAQIQGRYYGFEGVRGPNVVQMNPLTPQAGRFAIAPDTWAEYVALFETDAEGWERYSLWAADASREPVLIFDGLQLRANGGTTGSRRSNIFRLEYNTSTSGVPIGRPPMVAHFRNFVLLNTTDAVSSLPTGPE